MKKNKIVTNPRVVRLTLKSIIWIKQIFHQPSIDDGVARMNYLCRWHKGGRTEMKKNKNMFLTKTHVILN